MRPPIAIERLDAILEAKKNREPLPSPLPTLAPLPAGWRVLQETSDGFAAFNYARELRVIVSEARETDGRRWRHVSASKPKRVPNYEEMALVKNIFVGEDLEAYSVWAPKKRHVNIHPYCLHLWCPLDGPVLPDFSVGGLSI